jgi:hypothetical protein
MKKSYCCLCVWFLGMRELWCGGERRGEERRGGKARAKAVVCGDY